MAIQAALGLAAGLFGGGGSSNYAKDNYQQRTNLMNMGIADHNSVDATVMRALDEYRKSYMGLGKVAGENAGSVWSGQNLAGVTDTKLLTDTSSAVLPLQRDLGQITAQLLMSIPQLKALTLQTAGGVMPSEQAASNLDAIQNARSEGLTNSIVDLAGRFSSNQSKNPVKQVAAGAKAGNGGSDTSSSIGTTNQGMVKTPKDWSTVLGLSPAKGGNEGWAWGTHA